MSTSDNTINEKYCCEQFKYECECDPIVQGDNIHREEDGNYYFHFEGCKASSALKYCPYCGARLTTEYIRGNDGPI